MAGMRGWGGGLLAVWLGAGGGLAEGMDDRHLPVVPRTAAETALADEVLAGPEGFAEAGAFEEQSGGAAGRTMAMTEDAFASPSGNMGFDRQGEFGLGHQLFRKIWVAAPAMTKGADGLGPYYNARSCQDCHLRDGRGHLPEADEPAVGLLLRLGVPGDTGLPHPVYGGQLQTFAASGLMPEGQVVIRYEEEVVTLVGGMRVGLRRPSFILALPAAGMAEPWLSPRLAPPMIGLGLLEAIPAADILARADENDLDDDGISGRASIVMSAEYGVPMLGRFGWKAGQPTVREQAASAFLNDMGLSTWLYPDPYGDCTAAQAECRAAAVGQEPGVRDGLEVDRESLELITFYSRNLAVPDRRNVDDPRVLRGKAVFHDLGCASCHTPKHVTQRLEGQPEQSFQLIWPYTDLLLHDMGPGLAGDLSEGMATGSEWRTPPLWGIGLTAQVTGRVELLHDGRARSLIEAILWHGGEAEDMRNRVVSMPAADREALIAFLESL